MASWPINQECERDHPDYTSSIFITERFQLLVDKLAQALIDLAKTTPFDAVAGSGFSGLPICSALSAKLGLGLIGVRKKNEEAGTPDTAQGLIYSSRYVIIDDLISSGNTVKRVILSIAEAHKRTFRRKLRNALCRKTGSYSDGGDYRAGPPVSEEFITPKFVAPVQKVITYPSPVAIILYAPDCYSSEAIATGKWVYEPGTIWDKDGNEIKQEIPLLVVEV